MRKKINSLFFLSLVALSGCYIDEIGDTSTQTFGYRPVYGTISDSEIAFVGPQQVQDPGKIYLYGNYLLVNEYKKGIHVFDNTSPASPVNLGFLKILGNTDMAVKDNLLYCDHLGNLVSLTMDDLNSIQEKGRLPLKNWQMGVPPPAGFNFECVDPQQGIVVGWTKIENKNLKCYAIR